MAAKLLIHHLQVQRREAEEGLWIVAGLKA